MKIFVVISHNDGAMQSGYCCLFPDKASAYNEMLNETWQLLKEAGRITPGAQKTKAALEKELERYDGNIDDVSVDLEFFGVTYEWKIQECDFCPKRKSSLRP